MKTIFGKPIAQELKFSEFLTLPIKLTLKDVKEFIEKNPNLKDDTPIMIERIEDSYFQSFHNNGWKCSKTFSDSITYKKEQHPNFDELVTICTTNQQSQDPTLVETLITNDSIQIIEYNDSLPVATISITKEKSANQPVIVFTPNY